MSQPIPAPILNYCFSLLPEGEVRSHFGEWQDFGHYWVWSAIRPNDDRPFVILEMTEKGAVELNQSGYLMHPIPSGTVHHIKHLFGYWLASDADRIWIQVPREDRSLYIMIWGGSSASHREDRLSWFCPECGTCLSERLLTRSDPAAEVFIRQQIDAVRQFNADTRSRTCKKCGFLHPEAFGFYPGDDTSVEQDARNQW